MDRAPPLSFASIPRPAFGSAAQHLDPPARLTTKAERRYQRAAKTAAELLPERPEAGESVHCLIFTAALTVAAAYTSLVCPPSELDRQLWQQVFRLE
jgi:hypothetical protein